MHTFQTREAYEVLTQNGVLIGDSARGWEEFQEAYEWMYRQMDHRLPGSGEGLLWLWPTTCRKLLHSCARTARGQVMLTIGVPRESVLLSDFDDWHAVLNRSLHVPPASGESEEGWEARWLPRDDDFRDRQRPYADLPISEWPEKLRAEIEDSWEAIFDPETWRAKPHLQATARELHAGDVVRAVRIR